VYADTRLNTQWWVAASHTIRTPGTVPGKGFYFDASPSEAGEQREVQPAVEGQGFLAPTSSPPHEVAGFLMQSAMLGGRDLTSRALDQRPQVFAGEPADLDAKALDLRVKLRPLGEVSGRGVKELQQPARRTVVDVGPRPGGHHAALVSPVQITPITG
jgi:hypothetical protein